MPLFRRGKHHGQDPAAAPPPLPPAPPEPRMPPDGGDRVLAGLLESEGARDWPALRAVLAGYGGQDLTALAGNLCAHRPGLDEWLPAAAAGAGADPLVRLLLGVRTIERAWSVRTGRDAQQVPPERLAAFHALLREAEDLLYEAAELDRGSVAPWYFLLVSGRGLEVGLDVIARRLESVDARCPGHVAAHRQMLQSLCRKWSGSHERMHAFALECLRGPHGAALGELVPYAHIEHWLDLGGGQAGQEYIRAPEVRAELQEAADRTIHRPDYADPRSPHWAHNLFAMAFGLAGMWPQALAAFQATDGIVTAQPWGYIDGDNPVSAYTGLRDAVLEHV